MCAMVKCVVALVLALGAVLSSLACTPTQEGAVIGGATGATAGAILDHHHRTRGAAVGGVAGGIIGGVIGHAYEINRFCPACGRRYHYCKARCPYDGSALQEVR